MELDAIHASGCCTSRLISGLQATLTVQLQLRLQHTVEKLSVAAITYYIVSLIHYVLKGCGHLWPMAASPVVFASTVPIVTILVFLAVSRIRRAHMMSEPT